MTPTWREYTSAFFKGLGILCVLYLALSIMAYRFRHPDQTETQLFFNIGNALQWK